jgi:hypothetical protein
MTNLLTDLGCDVSTPVFVKAIDVANVAEAMPRFRALIAEMKDVELFVVSAGTGLVNPDLARRRFSRRTRAVRWRRAP